jgi:pSer/pThr/pTyr-binding forkhead associated (FHA) protein
MSVLRAIESKIEGLFEGVFGRAFRTHVQPVELARKLAKEMDEHRSVSVSRVYVPNEYTLYLSRDDRAQFASYEGSLVGELQEYLAEHARREGYALLTLPRVLIETDDDLAIGEFGIATRVAGGETAAASLPEPPSEEAVDAPVPDTPPLPLVPEPVPAATMVYRPAPAASEAAEDKAEPEPPRRETVTLTIGDRLYPVTSSRVVLGRSRECDVRVADGNVSRRHCEIVQETPTAWALVDLGSTNGTEVNGRRVSRIRLVDGDRITLGSTDVVFGRSLT